MHASRFMHLSHQYVTGYVHRSVDPVDVILFSFGNLHAATLKLLYHQLTHAGLKVKIVYVFRPSEPKAHAPLSSLGENVIPFASYVHDRAKKSAREFQKRLERAWRRFRFASTVSRACSIDGIPILPLIEPWVSHLLFSRKRFQDIAEFIEGCEEVMRVHQPKLVVTVDEVSAFGQVVAAVARAYSCKSLVVQHGVMEVCAIFAPLRSDVAAVWGPFYKKELVRLGVKPSNVTVTGNPRWDEVINRMNANAFDVSAIKHRLHIPEGRKVLVWAAQKYLANKNEVDRSIITAARELAGRGIHVVIKPHPEERAYRYRLACMRAHCPAQVVGGQLYDLLSIADAVVTGTSTTALDAMLFGKPVVSVNLSGGRDKHPYAEEGAALGAYTESQVRIQLERALFDARTQQRLLRGSRQFLHRQANGLDGHASKRLRDVALALVRRNA